MHWRDVLAREAGRTANAVWCGTPPAWTFSELEARAGDVAKGLQSRGIKRGDRVALLSYNCPEFLAALFGSWMVGATVVPINFRWTVGEVRGLLTITRAQLLVLGQDLIGLTTGQGGTDAFTVPTVELHALAGSGAGKFQAGNLPAVSEDDDALLVFTSGTTAAPRGVLLRHRQLIVASMILAAELQIVPEDVVLAVTPLYHMGALGFALAHLIRGASTALLPDPHFDPGLVLDTVAERRVTALYLTPGMYRRVFRHQEFTNRDLTSWRNCIVGSESVPAATVKEISEALPHGEVLNIYGLTECGGPCVTVSRGRDALVKAPSVGRGMLNTTVAIVDEAGNRIGPGTVGEIIVQGDQCATRYWENPEATAETFHDGWVFTGDLGFMDADGYLTLVDRKKDVVISGGENIFPAEIEAILYRHPAILEASIVGVPDPEWGEIVMAYVVMQPGAQASLADIQEYCSEHLASYKKPRRVRFLEALPRNSSGKVVKSELKAWARAEVQKTNRSEERSGR